MEQERRWSRCHSLSLPRPRQNNNSQPTETRSHLTATTTPADPLAPLSPLSSLPVQRDTQDFFDSTAPQAKRRSSKQAQKKRNIKSAAA